MEQGQSAWRVDVDEVQAARACELRVEKGRPAGLRAGVVCLPQCGVVCVQNEEGKEDKIGLVGFSADMWSHSILSLYPFDQTKNTNHSILSTKHTTRTVPSKNWIGSIPPYHVSQPDGTLVDTLSLYLNK